METVALCDAYASIGDWNYDEALHAWGTKWGDCDSFITNHEGQSATFGYSTAWGPMNEAILKISEKWPTLELSTMFSEPGMCFRGQFSAQAGEVLCQEDEEYDMTFPDEFEDNPELYDRFHESFEPMDFEYGPQDIIDQIAAEWREEIKNAK
jgi:hypothetical protein